MEKKSYICIDGKKVELSEETVKQFKKSFLTKPACMPEDRESGFFVFGDGGFTRGNFKTEPRSNPKLYYENGFWRKTAEGAQKLISYRKAVQRVWEWRELNYCQINNKPQNTYNYCITYNFKKRTFSQLQFGIYTCIDPNNITSSFSLYENVTSCIKECKEDLNIIFGVNE